MHPSEAPSFFSRDYFQARQRFLEVTRVSATRQFSHQLDLTGPDGQTLSVDVARLGREDAARVIFVSSGLHGVEGFFGSAVQLMLIESLRRQTIRFDDHTAVVLAHVLNPHGFAHRRRVDDQNVDLNRNFLRPGEPFGGSPEGYRLLHPLLNPARPPSRLDQVAFPLAALKNLYRFGMQPLKQSIASGQYDFPEGLFFGGHQPSGTASIVAKHLHDWLGHPDSVIHLDFHTGLGRSATYKLLCSTRQSAAEQRWLSWARERLGTDVVEHPSTMRTAYEIRGGFGDWCGHMMPPGRAYVYLCAEFGTYPSVRMLAGLRAENQAHVWGNAVQQRTTRDRLVELFCPRSANWRKGTLAHAHHLFACLAEPSGRLLRTDVQAVR